MLKPLNDHVVVKANPKEEKTASGLFLPETNKEKPEQGEVIAVGPGKFLDNGTRQQMSVKVGDKIIFTKYSPTEIKLNNEDYLILSESDILGVIE